jgi:hypothetical protein
VLGSEWARFDCLSIQNWACDHLVFGDPICFRWAASAPIVSSEGALETSFTVSFTVHVLGSEWARIDCLSIQDWACNHLLFRDPICSRWAASAPVISDEWTLDTGRTIAFAVQVKSSERASDCLSGSNFCTNAGKNSRSLLDTRNHACVVEHALEARLEVAL